MNIWAIIYQTRVSAHVVVVQTHHHHQTRVLVLIVSGVDRINLHSTCFSSRQSSLLFAQTCLLAFTLSLSYHIHLENGFYIYNTYELS